MTTNATVSHAGGHCLCAPLLREKLATVERERDVEKAGRLRLYDLYHAANARAQEADDDAARLAVTLQYVYDCEVGDTGCPHCGERSRAALAAHDARVKRGAP